MKNEVTIKKDDIFKAAVEGIGSMLKERFGSAYNSPLKEIMDEVVADHREEIRKIFDDALTTTLVSKEFKTAVREEFQHKVAKNLVGKMEGSVEKAVEVLRQNPTLKSRMILAVENIINENT